MKIGYTKIEILRIDRIDMTTTIEELQNSDIALYWHTKDIYND